MSLKLQHNRKTGEFSLEFTKHVINVIGVALIISGFTSLSSPWWLVFFVEALEKLHIQIEGDYQWAISGAQIIIGFVLLLFKHLFLDKRKKQSEQDKKTWEESKFNIDRVIHFFDQLVDDHSYTSSEDTEFHKSYSHFLMPQHSFQLIKTQKIYRAYSDKALNLHNFVGSNFFTFPRSQIEASDYRYCLAPHLNEDREGTPSLENSRQYSALSVELHDLHRQARLSFDLFIKHLKEVA